VVASPAIAQMIVGTAGGGTIIRVNSGGNQYVDGSSNTWSADYGYTGGNISTTTDAISGTTDDTLYQSERWINGTLSYQFTVPNGSYTVNLLFAEIYSGNASVGARVFDIQIEGSTVLSNLDIYSEVGYEAALLKSFSVTVSDGQINIDLLQNVENPKISAIEIIQN